jgi:hydrogenase maturation protease
MEALSKPSLGSSPSRAAEPANCPPPTLVIGIGNPTRGDDAAGPLLARKIDHLQLPGVEVQVTHQLTLEMAADWAGRKRVLVIDAAVNGAEVDLRQVEAASVNTATASHTLDPGTLAALAAQLYDHHPQVWLCTLLAEVLEFGEAPTRTMLLRIETAEQRLLRWLLTFS